MKNSNKLKDHPGKLAIIALILVLGIMNAGNNDKYSQGRDFPKPDPTKGTAWGYNYETKEYRYESYWPAGKPIPEAIPTEKKKSKKELLVPSPIHSHYYDSSIQDETEEDVDPQEIHDYYGH